MKRYLLSILLLGCFAASAQQKINNIWAFGRKAGINFNSGIPTGIMMDSMDVREACASICDNNGQLLFYTDGSKVFDRRHLRMPNGNNITGLTGGSSTVTESTTQGALIVPMPDSSNKYYLFSLTSYEQAGNFGRLYYSVINMNLNGGYGDIEPGRRGIFLEGGFAEKMIAVVGDRCNVWVLVHNSSTASKTDPLFKAFEITSAGVSTTPVVSKIGNYTTALNYMFGVMKVSPDRHKIVTANSEVGVGVELYDFDPAMGIVSNVMVVDEGKYYGACFSPDNSKLYISSNNRKIFQFDITLGTRTDIVGSKTEVATAINNVGSDLKLGPDGKIYFITDATHVGVINLPNASGTACQVNKQVVQLASGTQAVYGLPNAIPIFVRDTAPSKTYNITVCFKDSLILHANNTGWDYIWNDNSNQTDKTVYTSGIYTVSYHTAPCTYHVDTFKVKFSSHLPTTGFYSGCTGNLFSYMWIQPHAVDTGTYTYTWSDASGNTLQTHTKKGSDTLSNIQPGTYFVNMKTPDGCDTTLKLEMAPSPYQASFTADTLVCFGDSVHFANTSSGAITYRFYFGDGDSSLDANPAHLYAAPGTYNAMLVSYPCLDTAIATIVVDSTPYIYFITDSTPICIGKANYFYPRYQSNLVSLTWDFGDGTVMENDWHPTHGYPNGGTMVVTLTGKFRVCADTSFKDTITVYGYPVVNLGTDTSICEGQSVLRLTNLSGDNAGYQYLWSTDATTNTIDIIKPSLYWLQVSEHGCATADTILVRNDCFVAIPNAFTPNGDGVNDYFFSRELLASGVTAFHLQIFSSWGTVVFETNNTTNRGWDGLLNGRQQQEGVYVYLIDVTFKNGVHQQYKGNLTLIR